MNHTTRRIRRLATIATVVALSATWVAAQQSHYFSMLLRAGPGSSYETNVIYAVNAKTRTAEIYSYRLRNALIGFVDPNSNPVTAESISMGLDGTDYVNPHGLLMFSVDAPAPVTPPAQWSNLGVLNSAVFKEPQGEVQADIYGVPHRPSLQSSLNIKVVEENSGTLPLASNQYLPLPSLGLTGANTGTPSATNAANLIGFDYHLPPTRGRIFFTVSADIAVSTTITYRPSDILYLDSDDAIRLWKSHNDTGIWASDKIDGLSVCLQPAPQVSQNCVLSLGPGATTAVRNADQTGGFYGTATAAASADILIYKDISGTGDKLLRWRSTRGNGLTANAGPDIDSVVSIDPKRFLPGSRWAAEAPTFSFESLNTGGPSNFAIGPGPGVTPTVWQSVAPTIVIDWDFSFSPLGTGTFSIVPPLNPGEEKLVAVHYLLDGVPKSHYERVSVSPTLDNPAASVNVNSTAEPLVQFLLGGLTSLSTHPGAWSVTYDGAPPVIESTTGVTFYNWCKNFGSLMQPVQVEARAKTGSSQSDAVATVFWPTTALPLPTDLSVEILDHYTAQLSWTPALSTPGSGWTTELVIDDGLTVPTPITVTSPFTYVASKNGFHRIRLTTVSSTQRSLVLEGSFFVGIGQDLVPSRTIPATPISGGSGPAPMPVPLAFQPADLTLVGSTASLVAVPQLAGSKFWTLTTLDHNGDGSPKQQSLTALGTITGVTALQDAPLIDVEGSSAETLLMFAGWSQGAPHLVLTESEPPFQEFGTYTVSFPALPTTLGAIALEASSEQVLWVADGQLFSIDISQLSFSTSPLVASPIDSLAYMNITAVSSRDLGYYEVPASLDGSGIYTHLLTLDSDHHVVSSLAFAEPCAVSGLVHAHDPLPTTYASVNGQIEAFKMPLRVGPNFNSPFSALGMPYDLNNDGNALDAADASLFSAFLYYHSTFGEAAAIQILEMLLGDVSGWDVDGTSPAFPGDGALTTADFWVLLNAIVTGETPPSVTVPIHPNWFVPVD